MLLKGIFLLNQSRVDVNHPLQDVEIPHESSTILANLTRRIYRISQTALLWRQVQSSPVGRRALTTMKKKLISRPLKIKKSFFAKGSFSIFSVYLIFVSSIIITYYHYVHISVGRNPIRTRRPFKDRPTSVYSGNSTEENRLSLISVTDDDGVAGNMSDV